MKSIPVFLKFVIIPGCSALGFIYAFDNYVVQRAKTAIEPTQVQVQSIKEDVAEIKTRTINIEKILMENK